jgi:hypothetical protein
MIMGMIQMTNRAVMATIIRLPIMAAVANNSFSSKEADSRGSKGRAGRRCNSNGVSGSYSIDMHVVSLFHILSGDGLDRLPSYDCLQMAVLICVFVGYNRSPGIP